MRSTALILTLLAVGGCATKPLPLPAPTPATPASGSELVRLMHDRYAGKWYRSLVFLQDNTRYTPTGGEERSQWLEHQIVPGQLRIDYLPLEGKSGLLFSNNRVTAVQNGKVADSRPQIHPLLLLSADLYAQPVELTIRQLDSLGFKLGVVHETTWDGRRTFVVGAERGDTVSNQFWVEADRLLMVRLIQGRRRGEQLVLNDTRFTKFATIDGYHVPEEILFLTDGKLVWKEIYTRVRVNADLSPALFDAARWVEAQPTVPPAAGGG